MPAHDQSQDSTRFWLERWRPSTFTAHLRGAPPGPPPLARWEALLAAERSPAHRLTAAAARRPRLCRRLGLPAGLAGEGGTSLDEREKRVREIARTPLARRLRRLLGEPPPPLPPRMPELEVPKAGPLLDHEIERALALLRTIPVEELQRRGWHFAPNHYAWPLNDIPYLRAHPELWMQTRIPEGVDWDLESQERLMLRLVPYAGELRGEERGQQGAHDLSGTHMTFGGGDAYAYYGLVRDLRPRRVVEVGAGRSTRVLARALAANGNDCDVTVIEPDPNHGLMGELPAGWRFREAVLQDIDLELFEKLEAGDVLFYDGSHCVRAGSDVNWMFFEILPRLAPGVWIHFHDIFWPSDYWPGWVLDEGLTWNEQYVLQAFLMHNSSYRVRLACHMLWADRGAALEQHFPDAADGASVWIEKVA